MAETMEQNGHGEKRYIEDTTDYGNLQKRIETRLQESASDRFMSMEERKKESVYDAKNYQDICHGKYSTSWRGINLMKDPLDIIIYQQLLWHEKPKTIIEIGAYSGACAMWMADIARLNGSPCHVYAVDIDLNLVSPHARKHKDVTFIQGDAMKIAESFTPELLKSLPHPWVVTEDAHVDLIGCMEHFHQFMVPGDYFIIEDTCPDTPLISGQGLFEEDGYDKWGLKKHTLLEKFMKNCGQFYAVDSFYTDYFGYNGTFNWNGYIKRMK